MNQYLNNRELLKNLSFNTGTSSVPAWTEVCTLTEASFSIDMEQQDFYVWCDAIQRSIITGAALSIETTVKLDINNKAIQGMIGKITALLTEGTVAQFNNETVQFNLATNVQDGVIEYTKYEVPVTLNFSELGGAAEDASEFGLTIVITGKGKVVTG